MQFREWDLVTGDVISNESTPLTLNEHSSPNPNSVPGFPHFRVRGGNWRDRMRISPDRKLFAVGIGAHLYLGDVRSQLVTHHFKMEHVIVPVEFSLDGKYVAAAGQSSKILVWHTETGKLAMEFEAPVWPGVLAFSPDGTTLAAGYYDGAIGFWDLRVEREILQIKAHTFPVTTLRFSSDGKTLASGGWDSGIRIWKSGR